MKTKRKAFSKGLCALLFCLVSGNLSASHACSDSSEVKRVLVCSITQAFRHASIPYGDQALKEIAEAHPGFEIVDFIEQPKVEIPRAPRRPRQPRNNASAEQVERFEAAQVAYEAAQRAWVEGGEALAQQRQEELAEAQRKALAKLSPDWLKENRIDAVIFNNTSGDLFLPDLDGFIEWIEAGHGFIAIHAATDTLKDAERYTEMTQGVFDSHGPQVEATLRAGDKAHPANAGIGPLWHLPQEEIYLFRDHNREKVRVIWYMDHHPNRPDEAGYFPISWVRNVGEGRMFHTGIGHREDLFSLDPDLANRINPIEVTEQNRAHLLGGILWALGLAEGSGEPNVGGISTD